MKSFPGGKSGAGVYQTIINHMPPHSVYIEAFLGGGAILRHKRPARRNIGIDRDADALRAFADRDDLEAVHGDALAFLAGFPFVGDELVYCDPPYLFETRSSGRGIYDYELGDDQHPGLARYPDRPALHGDGVRLLVSPLCRPAGGLERHPVPGHDARRAAGRGMAMVQFSAAGGTA